jgi:uncharacterized metal-binding protein
VPSGKTHSLINLSVMVPATVVAYNHKIAEPHVIAVGLGFFLFATFFMGPDLDLKQSGPTRRWGLFRFLWRPYEWIFSHRGWSHSILIGSLTRLVYLAVVFLSALIIYVWLKSGLGPVTQSALNSAAKETRGIIMQTIDVSIKNRKVLVAALFGIWFADLLHILADRFLSAGKELTGR